MCVCVRACVCVCVCVKVCEGVPLCWCAPTGGGEARDGVPLSAQQAQGGDGGSGPADLL